MPTGKLHIVPLGGLGEFGMNCMAVRWGDDIIVIDAGLMFPEAQLLGVDIVVPDISYLIENRQKVRGIILTHGHEDISARSRGFFPSSTSRCGAPSSRCRTSSSSGDRALRRQRTSSTGHVACCTTLLATPPSTRLFHSLMPREPNTMRSALTALGDLHDLLGRVPELTRRISPAPRCPCLGTSPGRRSRAPRPGSVGPCPRRTPRTARTRGRGRR